MITLLICLAGGLSVTALANALWPPRARPGPATLPTPRTGSNTPNARNRAQANRFGSRTGPAGDAPGEGAAWTGIGFWAARRGVSVRASAPDLAITGYDHDAVLSAKILAAVAAGLVSLSAGFALNQATGEALPALGILVLAALLAAGAYLLPDTFVRRQARIARAQFERALPVWCDLAALEMAGAAAPAEALVTAAEAGTTWPVRVLRDTLYRAARARQGHWQALTDLGTRIGVDDLAQLGRLSELVSHEGAQVRDTLLERADGMRRRALSDALGQAGQRDESMRLAVLVVAAGVILLLLYPGVVAVANL